METDELSLEPLASDVQTEVVELSTALRREVAELQEATAREIQTVQRNAERNLNVVESRHDARLSEINSEISQHRTILTALLREGTVPAGATAEALCNYIDDQNRRTRDAIEVLAQLFELLCLQIGMIQREIAAPSAAEVGGE